MMKKSLVFVLAFLLVITSAFTSGLEIKKVDKGSVIISELSNPAVFDFVIESPTQQAEIYSFLGVYFSPNGLFDLNSGQNKIQVKVYPDSSIRKDLGIYNFQYELKGTVTGITKDTLTIEIVQLKDVLRLNPSELKVGDDEVSIMVSNTKNTNLDNLSIEFSSLFFNETKVISLSPLESKNLTLKINKSAIRSLVSGNYIFSAKIGLDKANVKVDSSLNYLPKEEITSESSGDGWIVRKTTYTRANTGNVVANAKIETSRDILSRLYTTSDVQPNNVDRNALYATYVWEKSLKPGEQYSVTTTTNYTLPFILIILVIVIAVLVSLYTKTNVTVSKKVSYVRTKGGEFALRVRLHVKANKYVENIQVIDRLPGMTQLYEKFGIRPDHIDSATRRLFWNIDRLNSGEERVYSYIIYSKLSVVGRFELPAATATYQREGKSEQSVSNRAFFVAETTRSDM